MGEKQCLGENLYTLEGTMFCKYPNESYLISYISIYKGQHMRVVICSKTSSITLTLTEELNSLTKYPLQEILNFKMELLAKIFPIDIATNSSQCDNSTEQITKCQEGFGPEYPVTPLLSLIAGVM